MWSNSKAAWDFTGSRPVCHGKAIQIYYIHLEAMLDRDAIPGIQVYGHEAYSIEVRQQFSTVCLESARNHDTKARCCVAGGAKAR